MIMTMTALIMVILVMVEYSILGNARFDHGSFGRGSCNIWLIVVVLIGSTG